MYFIIMNLRQKRQPDIGDEWKLFIVLVEKQGVGENQVVIGSGIEGALYKQRFDKKERKNGFAWNMGCAMHITYAYNYCTEKNT